MIPEGPIGTYLGALAGKIQEFGWAVQGVSPVVGETGPSFLYTVGLTEHQMPELFIDGMGPRQGTELLNALARHILDRKQPLIHGETLTLEWNVPFRVHGPIDDARAEMNTGRALYGEIEGYQILWPDKSGNYPGDLLFDRAFKQRLMPLL